jgi:hypothetical protein
MVIGTKLVKKAIKAMIEDNCDEVCDGLFFFLTRNVCLIYIIHAIFRIASIWYEM